MIATQLQNIAESLDVGMSDIYDANIAKLFSRKDRGMIKGSGDNR
jgi:hypothetical protein